jgi:hypothetical protein
MILFLMKKGDLQNSTDSEMRLRIKSTIGFISLSEHVINNLSTIKLIN